MRYLRLFLVALVFLLQASSSAAGSVHSCCDEMDCGVVQCAAMGCLTEQPPQFAALIIAPPTIAKPIGPATELVWYLPQRISEVWCPPD